MKLDPRIRTFLPVVALLACAAGDDATTRVTVEPNHASLVPLGTQQFTATVSGTANLTVLWTADGGTASASGLYTAPGSDGVYHVTATSQADPSKSATATVTVAAISGTVPVSGITLTPVRDSVTVGGSTVLGATVVPSDATNPVVLWTSGDPLVATVDGAGRVTGVAAGTTTITATTQDGNHTATCALAVNAATSERLRSHAVVLDADRKIAPWFSPASRSFDNYLRKSWAWALAAPKDSHGLPISYLYCAWRPGNPPTLDPTWENDVGEKIPNWVESARLYYQYTGDRAPLDYVKGLVDYSLTHGQTPSNHAWPGFPVGTSNAGDTEFQGFTGIWSRWDCHVDLAADMGFAYHRMYRLYGDVAYRDKAIHVADLLASHIVAGDETRSPWPYVVNSETGAARAPYAASWDGALQLFDVLIESNQGAVSSYVSARSTLKTWLLAYPMKNGKWVDGHSDVRLTDNTNLSATCGSDMSLYLFDHPEWDPDFATHAPALIQWTVDNFVTRASSDGLSGQFHGAYVPFEQDAWKVRMGYQSARLGAQYARLYAATGDATALDRAYRALTYNTYMMQSSGQSADGPTDQAGFWWSDVYGEAPRMYYAAMAGVPEWAPPGENHILYSDATLTDVSYGADQVAYTAPEPSGREHLRLRFRPATVSVGGVALAERADLAAEGFTLRDLGGGDWALALRRARAGAVLIAR